MNKLLAVWRRHIRLEVGAVSRLLLPNLVHLVWVDGVVVGAAAGERNADGGGS